MIRGLRRLVAILWQSCRAVIAGLWRRIAILWQSRRTRLIALGSLGIYILGVMASFAGILDYIGINPFVPLATQPSVVSFPIVDDSDEEQEPIIRPNSSPEVVNTSVPAITTELTPLLSVTLPIIEVDRTDNLFPVPLSTPTEVVYQSGLITFVRQNEEGKELYIVDRDGDQRPLIQSSGDIIVLDVSPDLNYLAVLRSKHGSLSKNYREKFFVVDTDDTEIELVVIATDGSRTRTVIETVGDINAVYTPIGQLLVAVLEGEAIINYLISDTDGSELRELYESVNVLPDTPFVLSTATTQP